MRLGQIGVRRATAKDAEAIAGIHDEAWRLAYGGIIPGGNLERMVARRGPAWWAKAVERRAAILVIEVGGRICGYATIGPSRMRMLPFAGEVYEIYMKPEYQGLGFGRPLFEAARDELKRYGFKSFAVRVLRDNEMAQGFYRRLGGLQAAETSERIGDRSLPVVVFGWPAP
ncbi:GNAT family N-acetyltransferase [Prosthecomicrobium hirschii]|uniref:GNAT family N-acetyltransferase n=1 Tax=Prosthecodimorpha hirschii TaxID=665126 RepID=UPI00221FA0B7|nr:GNAT family N-acetyltransferase [Prosthecomicrobium hirschii]MCW1842057.1 GNAT family N-acetyltransferase [Prosthecomicrobium hirschii]